MQGNSLQYLLNPTDPAPLSSNAPAFNLALGTSLVAGHAAREWAIEDACFVEFDDHEKLSSLVDELKSLSSKNDVAFIDRRRLPTV